MKVLLHPAIMAIGLSVLCCLGLIGPLISPGHRWIYHDRGPPESVFIPVILNIVLCWLVLTVLLKAGGRPGWVRRLLWSSLIFAIPLLLLKQGIKLNAWIVPHRTVVSLVLLSVAGWAALVAWWRPVRDSVLEPVLDFAKTLLGFAGLGATLILGQTLWCFWQARDLQTPQTLHTAALQTATNPHPGARVIWIILDELSYQQVYEQRFPGLQLLAFDRLAGQSTLFTHVVPAAIYTEIAVPSIITGLRADSIRVGANGSLLGLRDPLTGRWQPFHPRETIFQDAIDRGYRTGIAGWYNPYCRVLSEVIDRCTWTLRNSFLVGMIGTGSIWSNTRAPWLRAASRLLRRDSGEDALDRDTAARHIADYRQLSSSADELLGDSSIDFLLLHMPVPHPGGIYNRRTGEFTTHGGSYIDNLALADRYLGHVEQLLMKRGEWDSSTVVVMGDHSWRTRLIWEKSRFWTSEDAAASSGGTFDDRPAYIVKLPHQAAAARIDAPFDAAHTRPLLCAILDGRIRSPEDLRIFAAGLPAPRARAAPAGPVDQDEDSRNAMAPVTPFIALHMPAQIGTLPPGFVQLMLKLQSATPASTR